MGGLGVGEWVDPRNGLADMHITAALAPYRGPKESSQNSSFGRKGLLRPSPL